MRDQIESHTAFQTVVNDGIALLKIIKELTHTFEEKQHLANALVTCWENFYTFCQLPNQSLLSYYELFKSQVDIINSVGIEVSDPKLFQAVAIQNGRTSASSADKQEA